MQEAGAVEEALPLAQEAVSECKEVLGDAHLETLRAKGQLASFLVENGQLAESDVLFQETLALPWDPLRTEKL